MKPIPRRPRAPAPGARRIENAARRLFAAQGYAGTSMAEVAAAAGVSKATVFHHYRSKRALYEALVGDALAGFREQLIPLLDAERDLQDSLGNFAAAHVERLVRMQGTMRLIAREMLSGSAASADLFNGDEMSRTSRCWSTRCAAAKRSARSAPTPIPDWRCSCCSPPTGSCSRVPPCSGATRTSR